MNDHPAVESTLGALLTALGTTALWHALHDILGGISLLCGAILGVHGVWALWKRGWRGGHNSQD